MKITKQDLPKPPAFEPFELVIRVDSEAERRAIRAIATRDMTIPEAVRDAWPDVDGGLVVQFLDGLKSVGPMKP
jgi:hypothetical protein